MRTQNNLLINTQMQKGQALILILIGIVAILGIAGEAYYLGTRVNKPQDQNPITTSQPTPTFSSTPPATQNETRNWKVYKDNQYNFGFSYSDSYIISTSTVNPNCDYLTNNQQSCLIDLAINPNDSVYAPKASFYLIKGINSVQVPGQISSIKFNPHKNVWIFSEDDSPDQVLTVWDHTKSGWEVIKGSNGGSHGSASFYLISDYENDEVAIFAIPQSYRLRCDDFTNDISKQTQCTTFYQLVIDKYNGGKTMIDTWLPKNYISSLYKDAETMVKSFKFTQ